MQDPPGPPAPCLPPPRMSRGPRRRPSGQADEAGVGCGLSPDSDQGYFSIDEFADRARRSLARERKAPRVVRLQAVGPALPAGLALESIPALQRACG